MCVCVIFCVFFISLDICLMLFLSFFPRFSNIGFPIVKGLLGKVFVWAPGLLAIFLCVSGLLK